MVMPTSGGHLAQHRAFIARCNNGNRFRHVLAKRILDELAHFTPAFTNQSDNNLVEGNRAGNH